MTIDTSAVVAAIDDRDVNHRPAAIFLRNDRGPFFIPAGVMSEISYFVERRFGSQVLHRILEDFERGAFMLDCGERDLPRIMTLIDRYADLRLGYADATVIACAERRGGRVMTFDLRHFGVVAREGTIQIVP